MGIETSTFRDCCTKKTSTQVISQPGQTFSSWWVSNELNAFRQELDVNTWEELKPHTFNACNSCYVREKETGHSFRIAANKEDSDVINYTWPRAWNIKFGNLCNLACWSCSEFSSSVILHHKQKAHIPVMTKQDPDAEFANLWQSLEQDVLHSYDVHETVTLTLLGGEPLYNRIVLDFLNRLISLGLSSRTRLEFHTNGTVMPNKIFQTDTPIWQHVSIFVSIDAIGPYAEWLRYGGKWSKINQTIDQLSSVVNYLELHCTLSVLNINQLPQLSKYADEKNIKLAIASLSNPDFMALECWDQPIEKLLVTPLDSKFQTYYDQIGINPKPGASKELKKYIDSFKTVRRPLRDFDSKFAALIGW